MWRWVKRIILAVFVFGFTLIGVMVIANWQDEALEPGVADFFDTPPVEDKDNGYIAYAGLNAPAWEDSFLFGQKYLTDRGIYDYWFTLEFKAGKLHEAINAREFTDADRLAVLQALVDTKPNKKIPPNLLADRTVFTNFIRANYGTNEYPEGVFLSDLYPRLPDNHPLKFYQLSVSQFGHHFKGVPQLLTCWSNQPWRIAGRKSSSSCASANTLRTMIHDNQLLLDRYAALANYSHFVERNFPLYPAKHLDHGESTELLLPLQQLTSAKMALDASEGNAEEALKTWLRTMRMVQRMRAGQWSINMQGTLNAIYHRNAITLPLILEHMMPAQIKAHQAELNTVLDVPTFGTGGWDMAATMRVEATSIYEWKKEFLETRQRVDELENTADDIASAIKFYLYLPNATLNKFYHHSQEMIELASTSPSVSSKIFKSKVEEMRSRYKKSWLVLYNPTGKRIESDLVEYEYLIPSAQTNTAYLQMLKLYVDARVKQVPLTDMPQFVTNSPIHNPLADAAFQWDAATNSIYFNYYYKYDEARRDAVSFNAP